MLTKTFFLQTCGGAYVIFVFACTLHKKYISSSLFVFEENLIRKNLQRFSHIFSTFSFVECALKLQIFFLNRKLAPWASEHVTIYPLSLPSLVRFALLSPSAVPWQSRCSHLNSALEQKKEEDLLSHACSPSILL